MHRHSFADQDIDISHIATGDYWLESIVDPNNTMLELDETNNVARIQIHIDKENKRVQVIGASAPSDLYEDNDSKAITDSQPQGIPNSPNMGVVTGTRTISNLVMDDGFDWYRFALTIEGVAGNYARIDFDHALGDLDIRLRDAAGAILDRSASSNDFEAVSLAGLPAGVYYVEVYGYQGAGNPSYSLTLATPEANGGILPDYFEDNDTRAAVDARTPGAVNSPNLGQFVGHRQYAGLTMDDAADWYRFQMTNSGTAGNLVQINLLHNQGNLDMRLWDAAGNLVGASTGDTDSETITLNGEAGGVYYVEVFGADGALNPDYTLVIDVPGGSGGFTPDAYEDNDTREIVDGRPVGEANSPNLGAVSGVKTISSLNMEDGVDFYKFETIATGTSANSVSIGFTNSQGNLNLRLRDASGNILTTSAGTGDSESVTLNGLAAGVYYVEVYGNGGAANPNYTLVIDAPTAPVGIQPDAYENNDTRAIVNGRPAGGANSPNLGQVSGSRTISSLTMEDGFDYYRFVTTATGTSAHSLRIDFQNAQGNLGMRLRNASGKVLATSNGQGDVESISMKGRKAGVYYLEVFGSGGAANPNYGLTIKAPGTALAAAGSQTASLANAEVLDAMADALTSSQRQRRSTQAATELLFAHDDPTGAFA